MGVGCKEIAKSKKSFRWNEEVYCVARGKLAREAAVIHEGRPHGDSRPDREPRRLLRKLPRHIHAKLAPSALHLHDVGSTLCLNEQVDLNPAAFGRIYAAVGRNGHDEPPFKTKEGNKGAEVIEDEVLELKPHHRVPARKEIHAGE